MKKILYYYNIYNYVTVSRENFVLNLDNNVITILIPR